MTFQMHRLAIAGLTLAPAAPAAAEDWRESHPVFRFGVQSVETQSAAMSRYERIGARRAGRHAALTRTFRAANSSAGI